MMPRPPRPTRTDTLFPYTPPFRSVLQKQRQPAEIGMRATALFAGRGIGRLRRVVQQAQGAHGVAAEAGEMFLRQLQRERDRSEEHTSELQSLMRISYAVFCLKKNKSIVQHDHQQRTQ